MSITTMKRYELKFILNKSQFEYMKEQLINYMNIDGYGESHIVSIYYDTPDYRLIRTSIQKPKFKEKIRLRRYDTGDYFLEIKRKLYKVVYKRRIKTTKEEVDAFFNYDSNLDDTQIGKELVEFRNTYGKLIPAFLTSCKRIAYYQDNSDLRVTFDYDLKYQADNIDFNNIDDCDYIVNEDTIILEIKVQSAVPNWLSDILNKGQIYKSSFSKVGMAYKKYMTMNNK